MKEEYPCFIDSVTRHEYSDKINNLFKKDNFNWVASPALFSPNVFVKPNIYTYPLQLNTEWHPFPNVAKIGIHIKEGIAHLGIIAYPSINSSLSKKVLEEKKYTHEIIEGHPDLFFLVKPLDNLESLVEELNDIYPILLQK